MLTTKKVRQQLEAEFACDLTAKKSFVSDLILQLMDAAASPPVPAPTSASDAAPPPSPPPAEEEVEESQEEMDRRMAEELQNESSRPRRSAASDSLRKAAKRKEKAEGGAAPSSAPKRPKKPPTLLNLSPQLSAFFDGETHMGRGDVVKALWSYIKERGLQAEHDKRKIVLDDRLKTIFGKDRKTVDMFKMNALLSKHLIKDSEMA